ncbi:MAG: 2-hydroxyacyl-CoA dehydratase [Promethearchaeota archaeon]|nr:MAG: 2-hydroxyacyl-CoA dehydratase [Candidatus Lokiarchaeota archaeon]
MKKIGIIDSCVETPEELILSGGFIPYRLFGDSSLSPLKADEHLPPTHCVWARNILEQGLQGLPDDIMGIVSTHGCDCMNRQFDIWLDSVDMEFMYFLNSPLKRNAAAKKFFIQDMKELIRQIEEHYNVKITDEKIRENIQLMNKIRALLKEISEFRTKMKIKYSELHELIKKVQTIDKQEALNILEEKLKDVKSRPSIKENELKNILLTGSGLDDTDFIMNLENAGFHIVIDDLCIGTHYFWEQADEGADPLESIANYHFKKPIYSAKVPSHQRYNFIEQLIDTYEVKGVINLAEKFCESILYDHPFMNKKLKEKGVPYLFLEKEYNTEAYKQLSTRFDAFYEII